MYTPSSIFNQRTHMYQTSQESVSQLPTTDFSVFAAVLQEDQEDLWRWQLPLSVLFFLLVWQRGSALNSSLNTHES